MRSPLLRRAAAAAGLALLAACSSDSGSGPTVPITARRADRVLLVSVDGLRGDALRRMPRLWALAQGGLWTDSATTVVPSRTLPGHLAMLTGRDVTAFGITTNDFNEQAASALLVHGASAIFAWAKAAGGSSAAVVGGSLVPEERREDARTLLGVDDLAVSDLDAAHVADAALPLLAVPGAPGAPRVVFVHFSDVDLAGHASGWLGADGQPGADYLGAAERVDAAIARLLAAVAEEVAAGRTLVVVTADHGGGGGADCTAGVEPSHEHCTAAPADVTIPLVMLGDVRASRLSGHPRVTQLARTIAAALGVAALTAADAPLTR